jgi:hypothetical protein
MYVVADKGIDIQVMLNCFEKCIKMGPPSESELKPAEGNSTPVK